MLPLPSKSHQRLSSRLTKIPTSLCHFRRSRWHSLSRLTPKPTASRRNDRRGRYKIHRRRPRNHYISRLVQLLPHKIGISPYENYMSAITFILPLNPIDPIEETLLVVLEN